MTCTDGGTSLFGLAELKQRARLISSPLGSLRPGEVVVDLFCGAGGWGEGAKELGIGVDFAVNHWPLAIETHLSNNPRCSHHMGDAWKAVPREVIGGRKLGLLLASAACTTHSRARGSAPISKRVHMLGWCIARWMKEVSPRCVEIENVAEWKDWGPTILKRNAAGVEVRVQDPARRGQHFKAWWRYCERLGYRMEMRVLDAADFGSASRRKRLFIKARNDGAPIVWPEKTHGRAADGGHFRAGVDDPGSQSCAAEGGAVGDSCRSHVRGGRRSGAKGDGNTDGLDDARRAHCGSGLLSPFRTAAEIIDWSDLGTSIFERQRPLKPKTLARIVEGIRRYVLNDASPFVLRVTQGDGRGWHVAPVDQPLRTQTTRQDFAVATPVLASAGGSGYGGKPRPVDQPLNTVKLDNRQCLATPILATTGYGERDGQAARVHRVSELLGTCVDGVKQAVVCPVISQQYGGMVGHRIDGRPLGTITAIDHNALCTPVLMNNTSGHTGGRVDGPLPTVTTGGQGAVVAPVMAYLNQGGKQSGPVDEPLRTVLGGGGHAMLVAALMMEYYGNSSSLRRGDVSLGCVTTLDRHALVCVVIEGVEFVIVDILFRMLRPHELAAAMGFRADYLWPKTQRETVKLIGNAVSPVIARPLIAATFPGGRRGRRVAA